MLLNIVDFNNIYNYNIKKENDLNKKMDYFITIVIFLGITITLVGTMGSIIIMCMLGITNLREKCRKKRLKEAHFDELGEFVKL